jgi:hypothetical protein
MGSLSGLPPAEAEAAEAAGLGALAAAGLEAAAALAGLGAAAAEAAGCGPAGALLLGPPGSLGVVGLAAVEGGKVSGSGDGGRHRPPGGQSTRAHQRAPDAVCQQVLSHHPAHLTQA